jgi:transposase-like protein
MNDLTNPIFKDPDAARAHLEQLRWPFGPVCPHCSASAEHVAKVEGTKKSHRKGLYFCNDCKGQFTVTVGTVLEQSHVPLNKWLLAFYLMCGSKKGISAHQLHRSLKVSYKTAWFMGHRIREAMRAGGLMEPMGGKGGIVEADETYFGKTEKTRTTRTDGRPYRYKGKGPSNKNAVLSLVERGGEVRSFHIAKADKKTVTEIVSKNISAEARLMTDESRLYGGIKVASHERVRHAAKEYARGDVSTNLVEGYFSVFKRGMKGVYQHCSEKHLHRYLAEFDFRFNNRASKGIDDSERTETALLKIEGKRLTYRRTDEAQDA